MLKNIRAVICVYGSALVQFTCIDRLSKTPLDLRSAISTFDVTDFAFKLTTKTTLSVEVENDCCNFSFRNSLKVFVIAHQCAYEKGLWSVGHYL